MRPDSKTLLPVLPVRNLVLYPGTVVPVRVGRPRSIAATRRATEKGNWVLVVTTRESEDEKEATPEQLYHVGTLARIEKTRGNPKDGYQLVIRGEARYRIDEFQLSEGMIQAKGMEIVDKSDL